MINDGNVVEENDTKFKQENVLKKTVKHKVVGESNLEPNKKIRRHSFIPNATIEVDETIEVEENVLVYVGDNLNDPLFEETVEDDFTTPEYFYEETLDDEECIDDYILRNEESVVKTSDDSINDNKAETYSTYETPSAKTENVENVTLAQKKLLSSSGSKQTKSQPKPLVTPKPKKAKEAGGVNVSFKAVPRINDKFPDLPVPANINQYGDCLKTRLGRYHYGLTLTDPPCQFFQGVLKGASGQTLAAMFGDTNLISRMYDNIPAEDIGNLAMDTTFKVIPKTTIGVNRLLTISLVFKNQIFPLWYAVMSCSSTELYKRIIIEFQQHALDWPITTVLLNNEPALCNAVLAVFPDIDLYGSWFYYCYSIWKEVISNNLVEQCKTNPRMMTAVKMLMVVPYLPPLSDTPSSITMIEGFEVVREFCYDNNFPGEFTKVLDTIGAFWFNKVKSKNFTVFGKQTSALNYVEIFQLSLLSYMKPNGSVWTLTHSFQSLARTANTEFNKYLTGRRLMTKKNRARRFNVPIRQNIKRLMMGNYSVKTYLEASTVYCEDILDIFLHPLYPTATDEATNFIHTEGWKTKINCT